MRGTELSLFFYIHSRGERYTVNSVVLYLVEVRGTKLTNIVIYQFKVRCTKVKPYYYKPVQSERYRINVIVIYMFEGKEQNYPTVACTTHFILI